MASPFLSDLLGDAPLLDRLLQEPLGRDNITVFAQEKINGLSLPIPCVAPVTIARAIFELHMPPPCS
jgi:hypothetical protein